ncbi:MAG TPA: hypothetical protein VI756_30210 [Blastocatellia bacterium]
MKSDQALPTGSDMFIPRTAPLYENLATSFVIIDALVDDLCQGGFTGVVEVALRDADCIIVIGDSQVLSASESKGSDSLRLSNPSLIASKSKTERGRISVYKLSAGSAEAVAKRFVASRLYSGLSTEFADPEKMVSKLRRETGREWFIEIAAEGGLEGLIHLKNGSVHSVTSDPGTPEGESAAKRLLDECKARGGNFDVYHSEPGATSLPQVLATAAAPPEPPLLADTARPAQTAAEIHAFPAAQAAAEPLAPPVEVAPKISTVSPFPDLKSEGKPVEAQFAEAAQTSTVEEAPAVAVNVPERAPEPPRISARPPAPAGPPPPTRQLTGIAALGTGELTEAEAMIGIKRVMAEIASAIEGATKQVENRNTFSMYLRAGQLKIADRYPFLDPFGAEFEYHAGEIAFIGNDKPEIFIEGVTEALRLAVVGVVEASTVPDRLRAQIHDELYSLSEQRGQELKDLGLDESIQHIIQ